MINRRLLAILVLVLSGCTLTIGRTPQPPVLLSPGYNGPLDLPAGRYDVSWDAGGCTNLQAWWAPTDGRPDVEVPIGSATTGEATIEIDGGHAYFNHGALCAKPATYTITVRPAAAPS